MEFSSANPDASPLLTISTPIGLNIGKNPGKIINRSRTFDPILGFDAGLQLKLGKTIALVGGDIALEGGIITADEGRVELGSVGSSNFVGISSNKRGWQLNYDRIDRFQDINLTQNATISGFGDAGLALQIQGKKIDLSEGSQIFSFAFFSQGGNWLIKSSRSVNLQGNNSEVITGLLNYVENTTQNASLTLETQQLTISDGAQIVTDTIGTGRGVNLRVNASESISVSGGGIVEEKRVSSGLFTGVNATQSNSEASGNGGNLTIETKKLVVDGGANISTSTFGIGNAGNLKVIASDNIQIKGEDIETKNPSGLFARVNDRATGNGGNISIDTPQLSVLDGAQISTTARNIGRGGNLTLNVEGIILLSGKGILGRETDSSGLFVSAEPSFVDNTGNLVLTTADAGTLNLTANQLIVEKGAKISADTFARGDGANVNIDVSSLVIRDGSIVGAGSLLQPVGFVGEDILDNIRGRGGTVTISASESVEVIGTGKIGNTSVNSSLFTRAEGTGNAGNLTISTPQLTVAEAGNINASATGTGAAGSLIINAEKITLDNANLTAETRTGDKGNITLNNANTLLLRNNSQITTNASEIATGGDITIISDLITALDNSDITANAVEGRGGNIQITTQGLFLDSDSEITASSELGIDGTIIFNTPDVDPASGLVKLPSVPIDATAILARDLCKVEDEKIAQGSSFIITGRGGLTPTSEEPLDDLDGVVRWSNRDDLKVNNNDLGRIGQNSANNTPEKIYPAISEAQGWITNSDGTVKLIANAPKVTPQNSDIVHPDCQTRS